MPNLSSAFMVLAGDEKVILQNAQTLKSTLEKDKPEHLETMEIVIPLIKDKAVDKALGDLECDWFKINRMKPWI